MNTIHPAPYFPETKISNINLRISPGLKAHLIGQGARLGMNLSDYINLLIEQSEQKAGQIQQLSGELEALRQEFADTKAALQQLESGLHPLFVKTEGQKVHLGRETVDIKTRLDLLQLLVRCFKITAP